MRHCRWRVRTRYVWRATLANASAGKSSTSARVTSSLRLPPPAPHSSSSPFPHHTPERRRLVTPTCSSAWAMSLCSSFRNVWKETRHDPYYYWFTLFVGVNLLQSGFTNWCPMMTFLRWLGVRDAAHERVA